VPQPSDDGGARLTIAAVSAAVPFVHRPARQRLLILALTLIGVTMALRAPAAAFPLQRVPMPKDGAVTESTGVRFDPGHSASVQAKRDRAKKHPRLAQRLEPRLMDAWEQAATEGSRKSMSSLSASGVRVLGENVVVIVQCDQTTTPKDVASAIATKHGTVIRTSEAHVKAAVPLSALEDIASNVPGISFIRTPVEHRAENTVITEGRGVAAANPWHTAGCRGQGVRVAVIDGDFQGLDKLKAQDELPSSAIEMNFSDEAMTNGIDGL